MLSQNRKHSLVLYISEHIIFMNLQSTSFCFMAILCQCHVCLCVSVRLFSIANQNLGNSTNLFINLINVVLVDIKTIKFKLRTFRENIFRIKRIRKKFWLRLVQIYATVVLLITIYRKNLHFHPISPENRKSGDG